MSSRSPGDSEWGPRSRTSTSSLIGLAVSGRKAIGPRMPGRPSGSAMCGIGVAAHVSVSGHALTHLVVAVFVARCERRETVDVAVEHAECCGDEDSVVDFGIARAGGGCGLDVGWGAL